MRNDESHFHSVCNASEDKELMKGHDRFWMPAISSYENWEIENSGVLVMPVSAVGFVQTFVPADG